MSTNVKKLLFLILVILTGCNSDEDKNSDIRYLKKFYESYITELAKKDLKKSKPDSILSIYCTERLTKRLNSLYENQELDYDPFLNAQDLDPESIKTVKVKREKSDYNLFSVSYEWPGTGELINNIKLILINDNGVRKIDYVFIEGIEDPKYKKLK